MNRLRLVPTRRLSVTAAAAAVLAALLAAAGVEPWWLPVLITSGLVLAVALADAVTAVSPLDLVIEREHPGSMVRGDVGEFSWRIANPTRRVVQVAFADTLPPSLGVPRRGTVRLGARGHAEISAQLHPTRRGRFDLNRIHVRCAGPLGIAAKERRIAVPTTLRVLPPLPSRRAAELHARTRRQMPSGIRAARGRGAGTEFEQLREYVPGDDPRHIDWNATARLSRPIVRTFNLEQQQPVALLLDCGRTMAAHLAGAPRIEHALDLAVGVSAVVNHSRDPIEVIAYDAHLRARVRPRRGQRQVAEITEALFALEASAEEADHAGAVATISSLRRRTTVIIITELLASVVERRLAAVVRALAVDHDVVVASVADPSLQELCDSPATTRDELHQAAAAAHALERRREVAAALIDAGANVVDAPPGRVMREVADVYVELSRRKVVARRPRPSLR